MFRHNAGARVKDESAPCRSSDTAWESYPDAVSPTLPERPSPPLYVTVRQGQCQLRDTVPPTLIRPARRALERGRWNPRKGYGHLYRARRRDVELVRRVSSITVSPVRPSPLPRHHPGHCSTIPGAVGGPGRQDVATPAAVRPPAFHQPDPRDDACTTTRREAPTPPPLKPLLDGYRTRCDALPEARFARTAIYSVELYTIPSHVAETVRHDCKLPPLGL
jgi:hypothetical protein